MGGREPRALCTSIIRPATNEDENGETVDGFITHKID